MTDDSRIQLAAVQPHLNLYYSALSGRRVHILPYDDDDAPAQYADSHTTLRLPSTVNHFPKRRENEAWYKVALTHRAAHYQGGTFDFRYRRPAAHYPRLLPDAGSLEHYENETDLEFIFRMFTYRSLAMEIFTILEDLRLDRWIVHRYPGTRAAFESVRRLELSRRPNLATSSPRGALMEILVRRSLGEAEIPALPERLHEPTRWLRVATRPLSRLSATVEDTVEATLRVYSLVVRLPALGASAGPALHVPADDPTPDDPPWIHIWPQAERVRIEGDAVLDVPVAPVGYRDSLGVRYSSYESPPPPAQAEILRLSSRSDPGGDATGLLLLDDLEDEPDQVTGPPEPLPHDHHEYGSYHFHPVSGTLSARSPTETIYPEWDHVQSRYLPGWVRVRERALPPGETSTFFRTVLSTYRAVTPQLNRYLAEIVPEGLQRVRRLPDGDDLDVDAAIQAIADLEAGIPADDGVYVRQDRVARDVAVALLLDLSSSTAERLEHGDRQVGPGTAQLQALHGRPYRRIIDVAKETVALLMAAFERAADTYGLFGFSGTGRDLVDFVVIKDLLEPFSPRVAASIDGLSPLHTTRMGAAIRHVRTKLDRLHTSTKLLMVVSDGRPFDLDYGQRYGDDAEVDYALHDTRKALLEARDRGIRPFLLTVDQGGHDYLRDLCRDLDYEVLAHVEDLPLAVLRLYRELLRANPRAPMRVGPGAP